MLLLVGLGNPGSRYALNRHNIGFMAVDEIVRRHSFGPWRKRFQGEVAEGLVAGQKVLALKPQTFMNLSGQSVGEAQRFFKISLDQIVVLHDELDLAPGRIRVKKGGGNGGHNGLRSLDQHIGKDYRRVRLGIGHPGDKDQVKGYVLKDFAKADHSWIEKLLDAVADEFPRVVEGDDPGFMSRVAHLTAPPKPPKPPKPPSPPKSDSKVAKTPDGAEQNSNTEE